MNIIFFLILSLLSRWVSYTLPDGSAKLSFPSPPKMDSLVIESELGFQDQIKMEATDLQSGTRYLLIRTSYPDYLFYSTIERDSTKLWIDDTLLSGMMEQQDARLVYQNIGLLNGKPVKWILLNSGMNTRMKIGLIWNKNLHYALLCISANNTPLNKDEDQFFESFQLNEI